MTTTEQPEPMQVADRRAAIEVVAVDGLDTILAAFDDNRDAALDYILRAICAELDVQTTASAVLGQWAGGILGTGTTADDVIGRAMYQRGVELREHITKQIGWPTAKPIII